MAWQDIVIGYDGSPESDLAVDWAAALAERRGVNVRVVHAVELRPATGPALAPMPYTDGFWDEGEALLQQGVQRAADRLGTSRVSGELCTEGAVAALVTASKDAALVVTGSRGRSAVAAGLLGSVSYGVSAHAHCPAVVVRGTAVVLPDAAHEVVVGVDDSRAAMAALDVAADWADAAGAPLHIVSVGDLGSPESAAYAETTKAGSPHTREARAGVVATLSRSRCQVLARHPGLQVETEALFGSAGSVLAQVAARAGLLVLGSRRRGAVTGLLLGSVGHGAIHAASCPVMVVHPAIPAHHPSQTGR